MGWTCIVLEHLGFDAAGSKRHKESVAIKTSLRWAVPTIRLRLDLQKTISVEKRKETNFHLFLFLLPCCEFLVFSSGFLF